MIRHTSLPSNLTRSGPTMKLSLALFFIAMNAICMTASCSFFLAHGFTTNLPLPKTTAPNFALHVTSTKSSSTVFEKISNVFSKVNNNNNNEIEKNNAATQLLTTCRNYGQIGSKLTEDQRTEIDTIVSSLSQYSDPSPAKIPLTSNNGERHELIYSAAPGGSSGAIGPLVGKVSQSFLNETQFINRVELLNGVFKIELHAERKVLDDSRIRVVFKETAVSVFGREVVRKEAKGSGVWKYEFGGLVNVPKNGGREGEEEVLFMRVLKTPSTFVIVQRQ